MASKRSAPYSLKRTWRELVDAEKEKAENNKEYERLYKKLKRDKTYIDYRLAKRKKVHLRHKVLDAQDRMLAIDIEPLIIVEKKIMTVEKPVDEESPVPERD
jgi:hypothetical protein